MKLTKKTISFLLVIITSFSIVGCYKVSKNLKLESEVTITDTNNNFEIIFNEKKDLKKKIIKEKDENLLYSIYSYNGDVEIIINDETISLSKALNENKITMETIIDKAKIDGNEGIAEIDMCKDGGSQIFKYPKYSIIKFNNLDGNKDVYIGNSEMNINDLYRLLNK